MGYGALVFLVMWLAVLPLLDPVMLQLHPVSFFVGHLLWGTALGLVVGWVRPWQGAGELSPSFSHA